MRIHLGGAAGGPPVQSVGALPEILVVFNFFLFFDVRCRLLPSVSDF
jgi:hypothetical protein